VGRLEKEYELFSGDLSQEEKHPVVYIAALLFGIIATVMSVFWVFQMLGHVIRPDGHPLYGFIDNLLASLASSGGSFFATLVYGLMAIYMQIALVKGNTVFGFRIPYLLKVHPMEINKTYMNSLLFNSNLMLLASCAISFQALWSFPRYFQPALCFLAEFLTVQVDGLPLFSAIYGQEIPMIVLEGLVVLVLGVEAVRLVCRCRSASAAAEKEEK
jgi:hypothetical protein